MREKKINVFFFYEALLNLIYFMGEKEKNLFKILNFQKFFFFFLNLIFLF